MPGPSGRKLGSFRARTRQRSVTLPSPQQIFLKPRFVKYEPGTLLPSRRGVQHVVPEQRVRTLAQLRISENSDGSVNTPRYHLALAGPSLEPEGSGFVSFRDINAAIRAMGWHIPKKVEAEIARIEKLRTRLAEYHALTGQNWNTLSKRQQESLGRRIRITIFLLAKNPELLRSEAKIKAFERISNAADALKNNNYSSALLSLIGAHNDCVVRINELLAHQQFVPRRQRSMYEYKTKREHAIFSGLRELLSIVDQVHRPSGLSRNDQARIIRTIQNWKRYFRATQRARIPEFQAASRFLQEAEQLAIQGKFSGATTSLRFAAGQIAVHITKTADLYGDLIALVERSTNKPWREQIMAQQAHLVAENLEYWARHGFPPGFADWPDKPKTQHTIAGFFGSWARVARNTNQPQVARWFENAQTAFLENNLAACENALEQIPTKLGYAVTKNK